MVAYLMTTRIGISFMQNYASHQFIRCSLDKIERLVTLAKDGVNVRLTVDKILFTMSLIA